LAVYLAEGFFDLLFEGVPFEAAGLGAGLEADLDGEVRANASLHFSISAFQRFSVCLFDFCFLLFPPLSPSQLLPAVSGA